MCKLLKESCAALGSVLLILLGAAAPTAEATILQYDFANSGVFSGTVPTGSPGVYATAVFDDHGGTGNVTLTMSVFNNLLAGAYINDWYFNINSPSSLTGIAFNSGVAAASVDDTTACASNPPCGADGGGYYDFAFHFPTNNPGQLGRGNISVYDLTGTSFNASSFDLLSADHGGNGNHLAAVHVQGYASSAWLGGTVDEGGGGGSGGPLPEPASFALLGIGLLGVAIMQRRSRH
ncbi:MAG: PEP-CTERM sorting domain-containing protein [Pseudomonadota bacterium]